MSRIRLKQVDQISRKTVSDARDGFLRHCQLKNLAPNTYTYYKENLQFFFDSMPQIKFVDEINQELIENFIGQLMDRGSRVTAINARLRAVFVFLRYCFEQEYMEPYPLSLIKEDETFKEPYTDSELQKLLKQPQEGTWVEWRNWAVITIVFRSYKVFAFGGQSTITAYFGFSAIYFTLILSPITSPFRGFAS